LEAQIEDRNRATVEANRKDEVELASIYRDLAASLEPPSSSATTSNAAEESAQPEAAVRGEPAESPKSEPAIPKASSVEPVGTETLGVQDFFLALMHKYAGGTFDALYAGAAVYPTRDKKTAYKNTYATFGAMVKAEKAERLPGTCCWKPLKPRDPRPIRLPNGDVLFPNGDIQKKEAAR
jgi:hypothetical protein